ncbi:DNA cytosine methyltransferase [Larkinella punicea]|uniref:DNA cytosine methyltransferase n=1 Tax=Larkinella punicea TaxID=2315727 RepID=UPI001CA3CEE4|nr:DNA (cytosine-5-)-methyltransferase [Larkinella punicea]
MRPEWNVILQNLRDFSGAIYKGQVDLLAGGVPCPPFSIAGQQLGNLDERDLFPEAIRIAQECNPKAIMLENVRGLLDPKFKLYRRQILSELRSLGYYCEWRLLNSSDYGVSQLRPRAILVGLKEEYYEHFQWPTASFQKPLTIGELLYDQMRSAGWEGADEWKKEANGIAPTLVGGSKKHGGADLGPTRAKKAWASLGVDGKGLADAPPSPLFSGQPRLTLPMAALVQGFPPDWQFAGKKTPAYRQVGNAFPAPVAKAVGMAIIEALSYGKQKEGTRLERKTQSIFSE